MEAVADSPTTQRGFGYAGEDLIFIPGARDRGPHGPSAIAEHPAVAAATVDNLRYAERHEHSKQTSSTRRGFTDSQLRRAFHRLGQRSSGDVIVEKTPIHLLYADRFVGVPEAASCSPFATLLPSSTRSTLAGQRTLGEASTRRTSAAVQLWMKYEELPIDAANFTNRSRLHETLVEDTAGHYAFHNRLDRAHRSRSTLQPKARGADEGAPTGGGLLATQLTESELNEILEVGGELLRTAISRYGWRIDGP